nr:hypothetical protein [Nocardia tenerifensis]
MANGDREGRYRELFRPTDSDRTEGTGRHDYPPCASLGQQRSGLGWCFFVVDVIDVGLNQEVWVAAEGSGYGLREIGAAEVEGDWHLGRLAGADHTQGCLLNDFVAIDVEERRRGEWRQVYLLQAGDDIGQMGEPGPGVIVVGSDNNPWVMASGRIVKAYSTARSSSQ